MSDSVTEDGEAVEGDPIACPFCSGNLVVFTAKWSGLSSDEYPSNKADLDEYQCRGDCCGRSFWV